MNSIEQGLPAAPSVEQAIILEENCSRSSSPS